MTASHPLSRRLLAEAVGTAALVAIVVGSGIMAQRLAVDPAVALLANTVATGAGLLALITALGGISGAHFNPVVTAMAAVHGHLPWRIVPAYAAAQIAAGVSGTLLAHAMFDLPLIQAGTAVRGGPGGWLSEAVATAGLLIVIAGAVRHRMSAVPGAVAGYITAGYWFTASTCFANPAVTIARSATETYAGIAPGDTPGFILAQILGALAGLGLIRALALHRPPETP